MSTWYVRPDGGSYGSEDGTAYADAWDGLLSVVWGGAGVVAGDTLYVCGLHVRTHSAGAVTAGVIVPEDGTSGNLVTIRGDYPSDAGTVWGAAKYAHEAWVDEGSNTWSITIKGNHYSDWFFEDVTSSSWTVLDKASSVANCQATAGSHYSNGYTNGAKLYVHCSDNAVPTNRILANRWGYRFNITGSQYIAFQDIKFYSLYRWVSTSSGANDITFDGVTMQYGDNYGIMAMWGACDNITVKDCTLAWSQNGIYTYSTTDSVFTNFLFQGNTIHDMGMRVVDYNYDAHAIGMQGADVGIIEDNTIYNCGSGVTLYAFSTQKFKNTIVRNNFVYDGHENGGANSRGIETVCDGDSLSDKTNNRFYGNVVYNHLVGMRNQFEDKVYWYNNTFDSCTYGFESGRNFGGIGSDSYVRNNIFSNSGTYHIRWYSGATVTYTIDFDSNLYYPDGATKFYHAMKGGETNFAGWQAITFSGSTFDPNSTIGAPSYVNANGDYSEVTDFEIAQDSAAINAGEYLTNASGGASSSVTLVVDDALFFTDGESLATADTIQIENETTSVLISSIVGNTITLASAYSWADNEGVSFAYTETPDCGKYEYTGGSLPGPGWAGDYADWTYRKKLTIDNTNIDSDLTDFPLYWSFSSDSDIGGLAKSGGEDIRFADSSGNALSYKLRAFSIATGDATGKFNIKCSPTTAATIDIYVYYGNASASDASSTATWDGNYRAVWLLDEVSGNISDSTAIGVDATSVSGTPDYQETGKANYGIQFLGTEHFITTSGWSAAMGSSVSTLSFDFWFKESGTSANYRKFIDSETNNLIGAIRNTSTTNLALLYNSQTKPMTVTTNVFDGDFHHIAFTATPATGVIYCYIDGAEEGTIANYTVAAGVSGEDIYFPGNTDGCVGTYEDFRISDSVRSADWIKFQYANINEADFEVTVGSEESAGSVDISVDALSVNSTISIPSVSVSTAANVTVSPAGQTASISIPTPIITARAGASTYFIKNAGDDSKDGLSDTNAWSTVSKINGEAFSAGDTIGFNKGDIWRGELTIPSNGSAGSPITFSAYGSGADPIINGADVVSTWTAYSGSSESWGDQGMNSSFSGDFGLRTLIPANDFSIDAAQVRIQIEANHGDDTTVVSCYIGEKASSGDAFDTESGTITQITFDTGNPGVTITAGGDEWSDWVDYSFDYTKNYLVCYGISDAGRQTDASVGVAYYKGSASAESATANVADYTPTTREFIKNMSVQTVGGIGQTWKATLSTETFAVWMDDTSLAEGSDELNLSDHEWYWTGNVLYVRDETGDPDGSVVIEAAVRDYCVYSDAKSYYTVNGLTLNHANAKGIFAENAGSNNNFTNLAVTETYEAGIRIENDACLVQDCTITHVAKDGSSGVRFANDRVNTCEVDSCTISNILGTTGKGVSMGSSADGLHLHDSTIHTCDGSGVKFYQNTDDCTVENNTIYSCSNNSEGSGINIRADSHAAQPTGNIVRYNTIYDNNYSGINLWYADSNQVYYNILYNNLSSGEANWGEITLYDADSNVIYNNAIYNGGEKGISIRSSGGGDSASNTVKNNIILSTTEHDLYISGTHTSLTLDNNCYYRASGNSIYYDDTDYTIAQFSTYQSAKSQDANSLAEDPLMTDPAGDDFTLQDTSPCINAGADVSLSLDYAGDVVSPPPDIGAYETITSVGGGGLKMEMTIYMGMT